MKYSCQNGNTMLIAGGDLICFVPVVDPRRCSVVMSEEFAS